MAATLQPNIAAQEIEFDARVIAGVPTKDWDSSGVIWPDTSGNANDGASFGVNARYESEGFGGTLPDVRFTEALQDRFDISAAGAALSNTRHTVFLVVQTLDISQNMGLWGSNGAGSPGNRFIHLYVKANGSINYNREGFTIDVESAPGVIVANEKYVIVIRVDATDGMTIRVNGVQVGVNAGSTGAQVTFLNPWLGAVGNALDVGNNSWGDKRIVWNSFHSSAASNSQVAQMERFLGDKFGITVAGTGSTTQPNIADQEAEYDIDSYSAEPEGSLVGNWLDESGNGQDAVPLSSPEYEAGAWSPGIDCMRYLGSGHTRFEGGGFAGENAITMFIVFRTFDLSSAEALTGGTSFGDLFMLESYVGSDGNITYSFGTNEGVLAVKSSPGEVVGDGTCYVVTFQFTNTGGKIIRKAVAGAPGSFGVQIASNPASTTPLSFWFGARIADINGVVPNNNLKIAWLSGNLVAASVAEMEQMETFLLETFCGQVIPNGALEWEPCDPPVSTVWTPTPSPSTIWTPS